MDAAGEGLRSPDSSSFSFSFSSSTHDQEQEQDEEEEDRTSAPKRLPTRSAIHLFDGL